MKRYSRTKKITIQGTPDCQSLFLKYFKEIPAERKHDSPPFKEKNITSQNEIKKSFLPQKEPVTLSRPVPVVEFDTDNKTSSKDQSKEVKDLSFLTTKNTSITTKFLERSGSILSARRPAQITQNKEVLIKLESEFQDRNRK